MKLLRITKQGENYKVRSEVPVRVLGISLGTRLVDYLYLTSENKWVLAVSKKPAGKFAQKKLNKWLKDHKRFIEGQEMPLF
ncbi:hypothetical protein ACW6QP_04370 [Salegentibacter sp. HM20]